MAYCSGAIKDINPRASLMRKADIELSEEGAIWLETKFEGAKKKHPLLTKNFLDSLYQGNPKV